MGALFWQLILLILQFFSVSVALGLISVSDSSAFDTGNDNCRRIGIKRDNISTCYELKHNSCFGTKLPYYWSTSELVHPNWTQQQLQNDLTRWEGLKSSPKCWAVIQPLLCAVYMPKCHEGVIELPSQELCKVTRSPCRLVEQVMKDWPEFLKCDDPVRYPPNCKNSEIRMLQFNTTSKCMTPLISVEDSFSYYEGFEGCGLKCKDSHFTEEQHNDMYNLIFWGSLLILLLTGGVIITYLMDWKSAKGMPSVVIFYVNVCYFLANLGWILQFLPNAKQDIVCRKDDTIRRNEHRSGENVFCILVFVLIYFGSLAALGWLAVFAYVWNLTCNAVGRIRERVDNQSAYFHAVAWPFSAGMTILIVSLEKVDGSSLSGICFVGYMDSNVRIGFVLVPFTVAFIFMLFFFCKGQYRLINVLMSAPSLIPESGRKHLKSTVIRVFLFTITATVIIATVLGIEIYHIQKRPIWHQSMKDSLVCQMNLSDVADCGMTQKPSFGLNGINICMFFAGGILVSSWAWTGASIETWKRGLARWLSCGTSKSNHRDAFRHGIPRDRLIAQAYGKRHEVSQNGRLSLDLISIHGDPIGLHRMLDPNQLCQESISQMNRTNADDLSSEFAAALPHLLHRRNAITIPLSSNNSCVSEDNSRPTSEIGNRQCSSHSNLEKPGHSRRKFGLSKLKEKLGSRSRIGRKARRGSFSSFESSEIGMKHYQSSNSDLDKPDPKRKFCLKKLEDSLKRRNGVSWKNWSRRSSIQSLENSGIPHVVGGANVQDQQMQGHKRTILVREFSMQTSFETLPLTNIMNNGNFNMSDKCVQTSIECLLRSDFATQTKKSATKKQKKKRAADAATQGHNDNELKPAANDRVLQLLTPG